METWEPFVLPHMAEYTMQDVIDRLARIETKLDSLADHDKRIRSLERWRSFLAGGLAVLALAVKLILK